MNSLLSQQQTFALTLVILLLAMAIFLYPILKEQAEKRGKKRK
jgi:preprotein translocase subunit YajC